jgi:hypothetical protein
MSAIINRVLLVQLGTVCECFVATSVIKGICRDIVNPEIYVIVSNEDCKKIFRYNDKVKNVYCLKEVPDSLVAQPFAHIINLSPTFSPETLPSLQSESKHGFNFSSDSEKLYDVLYGESHLNKNIFQAYYHLAGMNWRGEGYSFSYYPKSKSKKGLVGLSVANANLRSYIDRKSVV